MSPLPMVDPARWFAATDLGDGLTHVTEPHVHHYLRCNVWHLRGRDLDVVIDTGLGLVSLLGALPELFRERRTLAVATHYHFDHVGGLHEFDRRAVHRAEAGHLGDPAMLEGHLDTRHTTPEALARLIEAGYDLLPGADLLDAAPSGVDVDRYRVEPCRPTLLLDDGDEIDLGDRILQVLHLPGHSPGSIGLLDPDRRTLFSGDAVYDGPLLDWASDADVHDYVETMVRLRALSVDTVHGGHEESFDGRRLQEICDTYLAGRAPDSIPPGGVWQRGHQ